MNRMDPGRLLAALRERDDSDDDAHGDVGPSHQGSISVRPSPSPGLFLGFADPQEEEGGGELDLPPPPLTPLENTDTFSDRRFSQK